MATKTRQSEAHSSTQPICTQCEQPIMPGPEFTFESRAHMHRRCFRQDVHQEWIAKQSRRIWRAAFAELYIGLPQARVALVDLFKEYRGPKTATISGYIACLNRALELVKYSSPSNDNQSDLTEKVRNSLAAIRQMTTDGAN